MISTIKYVLHNFVMYVIFRKVHTFLKMNINFGLLNDIIDS